MIHGNSLFVGKTECGCGLNDKNSGCVGKLKWTESIEEKKLRMDSSCLVEGTTELMA